MEQSEIIMTPDVAMRFLVWTVYYHDIEPLPNQSFGRFLSDPAYAAFVQRAGVQRLDRLQDALFRCFEAPSVARSAASLRQARALGEPCPFTEESLADVFIKFT